MSYKDIISKQFGDVITSAKEILDKPLHVFSISPALDIALSGGIPEGSWVSFTGPPGCGKSTTALQLMASYQKAGRKCFYLDVEHRLKKMNMTGVHGINPEHIEHIHSIPEKILTAEQFLEIACQIMLDPANYGGIMIIDSTSALCPSKEIVDPVSGEIRSIQPKIMASFCRKMAGVVNATRFTVVIIQHLITNTSGYGAKWMTDGGEKVKYQLDVKLVTTGTPEKYGPDERKPLGQIIEWKVEKSALGQSGTKCHSYLKYGYGLDEAKEMANVATDLAIINKKGAWFSFQYGDKELKYQGEEKLSQALRDDPQMYEAVASSVRTMLGI